MKETLTADAAFVAGQCITVSVTFMRVLEARNREE